MSNIGQTIVVSIRYRPIMNKCLVVALFMLLTAGAFAQPYRHHRHHRRHHHVVVIRHHRHHYYHHEQASVVVR
jgi:hypothetical protein